MMFSTPMTLVCRNDEGSSMAQNQKLRLNTSAGDISMPSHVPYMELYLSMCSKRSSRPATHPMPPSLMHRRSCGNRTGILEKSQSTAAYIAYAKNNAPVASLGASGAVVGEVPDEPTCRHTTVPVSSHAAISGSQ